MEQIYSYIDGNSQRFIDELATFVKQPSISSQGIGIEDCANLLTQMMEAVGISYEVLPMDGDTNPPLIYGELMSPRASKILLIYGHYDVQPADPLDEWQSEPFEPSIRDETIFARGASDDKGQLMCHLWAVQAWIAAKGELPVNVKFVLEGEEECSGDSLAKLVLLDKDRLKADYVVISDGSQLAPGAPAITYALRGLLPFSRFDVGSLGRLPGLARKAVFVAELTHLLDEVVDDLCGVVRAALGGFESG